MTILRIFLGVVIIIFAIGLYIDIKQNKTLNEKFIKTKAIVVNAKNRPNGDIQDFELSFDINGEAKQVKYDRTIIRNNTYSSGDTVTIFYDTQKSSDIVLDGSLDNQIKNNIIYISLFSLTLIVTLFWQTLKKLLF